MKQKESAAKETALSSVLVLFRWVRNIGKGFVLAVAGVGGFVLFLVATALVFASWQRPVFVNKDLRLDNRLHVPAILEPHIENGQKIFELTARQGQTQILDGFSTKTMGYNGSYLGPTIRVRKGDAVRMQVANQLPEATTTHWHGMHLPAVMDGAAHQVIRPNETWQPHWTITNEAASLWYHPHLMGKTGEQVYHGLGGMFIVDDDNADTLTLPKTYGVDDIPLIVQDRQFDEQGQLVYRHDHRDLLGHTGMHGDKILVNGTYAPYVEAPAKQVRLRVLNGSNARRYNFAFADGRTFYQIATDGGFLEKPVARTQMILSPAERAEIVLDLTNDTKPLTLMSEAVHENNRVLRFVRTMLRMERDENQRFKILELRPQATTLPATSLPQKLNTITPLKPGDATTTRRIIFDPGSQSINGKKMDHMRIDQIVYAGDTEIWEVDNHSGVYHPFHIHGVQFQIMSRNGKPPEPYERGWKDTVRVENGEKVHLIMRMPEYSDPHLPYMFHCHILEHEDMGMMGQFVVVNKLVKPQEIHVLETAGMSESQHQH